MKRRQITFKRNGRYDQKGLQQLNRFLRDWRRNEPTKMDPRLFDLVWEVYQKSGSRGYIHVVSAYRSPATNSMLRSRSKGVAKKSQHMLGKAMDFYIPDVKLKKLREIGMKFEVGGVGYYPDLRFALRAHGRRQRARLAAHEPPGAGRALPRRQDDAPALRRQAAAGLPAGGRRLQAPRRRRCGAGRRRRIGRTRRVPASSETSSRLSSVAAGTRMKNRRPSPAPSRWRRPRRLRVPAAGPTAANCPASRRRQPSDVTPEARPVVTETEIAELNAPVPLVRPAFRDNSPAATELALVSPTTNNAAAALNAATPALGAEQASEYADLGGYKIPVPELLGKRTMPGDAQEGLMTASAGGT